MRKVKIEDATKSWKVSLPGLRLTVKEHLLWDYHEAVYRTSYAGLYGCFVIYLNHNKTRICWSKDVPWTQKENICILCKLKIRAEIKKKDGVLMIDCYLSL